MNCSKCGSSKVVPRARVIDRAHYGADGGNVRVAAARKPQAFVFKGLEAADMHARVCGDCGAVELFIDDAAEVYAAYEQGLRNSGGSEP